jgi:hypothetical protein
MESATGILGFSIQVLVLGSDNANGAPESHGQTACIRKHAYRHFNCAPTISAGHTVDDRHNIVGALERQLLVSTKSLSAKVQPLLDIDPACKTNGK